MKNTIFRGIATAIITPINEHGIDYERFGALIDWQIEQGIDGLVVCGTTGEASTLTIDEHKAVIDFAAHHVAGRVPVIAGTGSNETHYAIDLTQSAADSGADAALVVTPYYNKATQNGLIRFYTEIADTSEIPIILYNVPSRTGMTIEPSTYAALAGHENIVGIKEANGDMSKIVETMALLDGTMDLYSGNDDQLVPLLAMGASGCISVLSNLLPAETKEIYTRFEAGDVKGAMALQCRYHELIMALFSEVSPIPIKAAMSARGFCDNFLRLPLTTMEPQNETKLFDAMRKAGIML